MSRYEHCKHTGTIESHIKKFTSFPGLCGLGNVCLFSNFAVLIINCAFHTQELGFIHHLGVLIPQHELIKITAKLVPNKNMVMGSQSHQLNFFEQFKFGRTNTWWRHQMETFSALLAICAGNSPVSGEFPAQRPVTRSFDVSFDLRLNKRLSKQWRGWWF